MDKLRLPLYIAAMVLFSLAFFVEIGSNGLASFLGGLSDSGLIRDAGRESRPGMGIPCLALMDGLVLFTLALMSLSLVIPADIHARLQGLATLIFSISIIIAAIAMLVAAFAKLLLMVGLLFAFPFGTIAYFTMFASFQTGTAKAVIATIMLLKIFFAVVLVFAHQKFIENKSLVVLVLCSLLVNIIVSFLHGIVPGFLVSITDAVAAIVLCIVAIIWAIVYLVGSVVSVVKAVA